MSKFLLFPDIDTSPSLTSTPNCTCTEAIWQQGHTLSVSDYDFSNLEFMCETLPLGAMTHFAATDMGAPVVSSQLKALLESLNIAAQYFPASVIVKKDELPTQDMFVVNLVGMVNCIDFDKSELEVEEEEGEIVDIIDVGTLVLNNRRYDGMYRMYLFERVIVVEGYVAEKLKALNISGLKLIEPENWDGIASSKS